MMKCGGGGGGSRKKRRKKVCTAVVVSIPIIPLPLFIRKKGPRA